MTTAFDYARELIEFDSVSSRSNVDVTDHVEAILRQLDFEVERLEYNDARGVRKASVVGKRGSGTGGFAYFGHTDVVPADTWVFDEHGPFEPTVKENRLYGRGSCDMKGSVACMLAAAAATSGRSQSAPIYITCTADEEVGMLGAEQVANESQLFQEMVSGRARGVIGEPTRLNVVHGHKGGRAYRIIARGRAAHSSTAKGINANRKMIPFLVEMQKLCEELETDPKWQNPEFDPPIMTPNLGINDQTRAINITPPQSICTMYFRPMPGMDVSPLTERIRSTAESMGLELETNFESEPLYISPDAPYVKECLELTGAAASRTVSYGTDGARLGALEQLVVVGPGDIAQAHTHDEWIDLEQLELGTALYTRMIEAWCL